MKSHHTMNGFYGQVGVEVMISGVHKGTAASRAGVVKLIDDTTATYGANLETVYLVSSEVGSTSHTEQRGFTAHDGITVKVEAGAQFRGTISLGDARAYLGPLIERIVDRIEQYLIDKIDGHESVLEDLQMSVDAALTSPRVLV